MKTADINTNLVDSYYTLLKSLSSDNKLELIAPAVLFNENPPTNKGQFLEGFIWSFHA
ncbi:hypothetical protein ACFSPU_11420 [Haoranjiania flava]|uniref:Uncharacterized protein n=1 Tax=Haoranjiania flava TaxID=1856322 RepID=A0AAE3IKP1_9BACT|nr:hypothetical protein [Haoranjiania flava]MCU7693579.1 hypothetical protein [Haoranjiania flava]